MRIKILCLNLLILLMLPLRHLSLYLNPKVIDNEKIKEIVRDSSAEGRLAMGLKIKLSEMERADLELLKGLSEDLKNKIFKNRHLISMMAKNLPEKDKHIIFQKFKGIGPKKSLAISRYLTLE